MKRIYKAWIQENHQKDGNIFYTAHVRFGWLGLEYNYIFKDSVGLHLLNSEYRKPTRYSSKKEVEEALNEVVGRIKQENKRVSDKKVVKVIKFPYYCIE